MLRKVSDLIEKIESVIIFLLVLLMVIFSFVQIVLRNFFAISIFWIDDFARHAVLWVGFIAMSVVTSHAKHINIDVLSRFFKGKSKRVMNSFKYLVSAVVSGILVYASITFVQYEKAGGEISQTLKIPVWYLELFFPVVFFLTSVRFVILTIEEIKGKESKEHDDKGMMI